MEKYVEIHNFIYTGSCISSFWKYRKEKYIYKWLKSVKQPHDFTKKVIGPV